MKYPKELVKLAHKYRDANAQRQNLDEKIDYYRREMKKGTLRRKYRK